MTNDKQGNRIMLCGAKKVASVLAHRGNEVGLKEERSFVLSYILAGTGKSARDIAEGGRLHG
ncbi:MAG: hypothetical protein MJ124_07745 [Lachnospiraceae bacterium]|nr:hypothetical protein [Lachnospiraceae bacterium]